MWDKLCRDCIYYEVLDVEKSGIKVFDDREWEYNIGRCNQTKSVHSGRDNLPSWISCEYWKKRT